MSWLPFLPIFIQHLNRVSESALEEKYTILEPMKIHGTGKKPFYIERHFETPVGQHYSMKEKTGILNWLKSIFCADLRRDQE